MKAILYAPGCEIQTLDVNLTGSDTRYSFIYQRVVDLEIDGILTRTDRLWRHQGEARSQVHSPMGRAISRVGRHPHHKHPYRRYDGALR